MTDHSRLQDLSLQVVSKIAEQKNGTKHSDDCDWHCEQYWWECTCGAVNQNKDEPDIKELDGAQTTRK